MSDMKLTPRQEQVLMILAEGPAAASDPMVWWPLLNPASVPSIMLALGRKGLVDVAGWDVRRRRTYCLTQKGRAATSGMGEEAATE